MVTNEAQCRRLASGGSGSLVPTLHHSLHIDGRYPSLVRCHDALWLVNTVHNNNGDDKVHIEVRALELPRGANGTGSLRRQRQHIVARQRAPWPLGDDELGANTGATCLADGQTLALFGGLGVSGTGIMRATATLTDGWEGSNLSLPEASWSWSSRMEVVNTGERDSTGCHEARTDFAEDGCEFDGKLSFVRVEETRLLHMYARANLVAGGGGRHAQVASSRDDGRTWSRWEVVELEGYTRKPENDIYYFNVQYAPWSGAKHPPRLLALYPAVIEGVGGVYASFSTRLVRHERTEAHWSPVHWSSPTLLLASPALDQRTPDHPIGVVFAHGAAQPSVIQLLVMHNVDVRQRPNGAAVNGSFRDGALRCDCPGAARAPPPFVCAYTLEHGHWLWGHPKP